MAQNTNYDNETSLAYKDVIRLNVPKRYLLISPNNPTITIESKIKSMIDEDPNITLGFIWDKLKHDYKIQILPSDIIGLYSDMYLTKPTLSDEIQAFYRHIKEQEKTNILEEHEKWKKEYNLELQKDYKISEQIIESHRIITELPTTAHTPLELNTITVEYYYTIPDGVNTLPDFFNRTQPSYIIPFIQLNGSERLGEHTSYYKIYKGVSIDLQPRYENTVIPSHLTTEPDTMYMNVWTGPLTATKEETEEYARIGKKINFHIAEIQYIPTESKFKISVTSPRIEETISELDIINRIHEHILVPLPNSTTLKQKKITGTFSVLNVKWYDTLFLELVMNDPIFSPYFYMDETSKVYAEKTVFTVHYKMGNSSKSVVTASFFPHIFQSGVELRYISTKGKIETLIPQENIPVINVHISMALTHEIANSFVTLLTKMFTYYSSKLNTLIGYYEKFIPEFSLLESRELEEIEETNDTDDNKRISALKRYAPDLFISGYARICQNRKPVPVMNTEDEKKWITKNKQIIKFPKNTENKYVCPDDDYPFVGLINNNLQNKHEYPYLPCCYKTDQSKSDESNLNKYLYDIDTPDDLINTKHVTHIFKTNRILDPLRFGKIHSNLTDFLRRAENSETESTSEYLRFGVIKHTENSFIHCIFRAIGDVAYDNAVDKIEFIDTFRRDIFKNNPMLFPELVKQELYDMTNENIKKYTTNNIIFFDPLKFYRIMEELFKINIYIFSLKPESSEGGLMLLPRHKNFHSHIPQPNRPVVLILRHWGSRDAGLNFPQCELIVQQRSDSHIFGIFDKKMNNLLYSAISYISNTLTWSIDQETEKPKIVSQQHLYSIFNYEMFFGQIPIVGQIIDNDGKARLIVLRPKITRSNTYAEEFIFLNILPSYTFNTSEFTLQQAIGREPAWELCIQLFGIPTSYTVNNEDYITGLYFGVGDIKSAFYCQIRKIKTQLFKEQIGTKGYGILKSKDNDFIPLLIPDKIEASPIQRLKILKKTASFIEQIITYCFLIDGQPEDIEGFLLKILTMRQPGSESDSLKIYDISHLMRIMPFGKTSTEVLTKLESQVPFIRNGKLLCYDSDMALGIYYQLNKFYEDHLNLRVLPESYREFTNYYSSVNDFIPNPNVILLLSLKEFNNWASKNIETSDAETVYLQNLKNNIQNKLVHDAFIYQEPYIYKFEDIDQNNYYIVQNVQGGDLNRAINVAITWNSLKINLGYKADPYDPNIGNTTDIVIYPAYKIYRISISGTLEIEWDKTDNNVPFLRILNYAPGGIDNYAALLQIL